MPKPQAAPPNSSRVPKLKKRFLDVLSGSVQLNPRGATLFLEGLCVQDDPAACLDRIIDSAHGISSVQSAMQFDLSVEFMNGLGSTVLEYLLRACNVGGDTLDNLLFHVVEPPIFWDAFVHAFQKDALSEDAQLVFAKLLSRLMTLQNQDTTPYRAIATQSFIQESLIASSKHEIREIGHLIRHMLSSAIQGTVLDGPGGRHDNDFVDYHDIAILPTADEILCRKPPFLRATFHDEHSPSEALNEDHLDNTFRMLREDMLFDVREEVETALQKKKKHRDAHLIANISLIGIYTDRRSRWGVKVRCSDDFKQLKNIAEGADRIEFLRRDPRGMKIIRHQSLVCLASGQDNIISFGTVNRVEELLACNPPVIVLQLDGAVNIKKTLTALCASKDLRLLQIDAPTFSFEPVLTALQKMEFVPLIREIVLWNEGMPITTPQKKAALSHIASMVSSDLSVDLSTLLRLPMSISLDKSQARSLITGLTQRVSLIQGPPGTGKSFIGTILAKAIHDKTSLTILVVCYTNHALDQFLGDLLKYEIPAESMIRLGGRASQSVEHLSLRNQPRGDCQYNWNKINELRGVASGHEVKLGTYFRELSHDQDTNLMDYLELENHEFFQAFHVPAVTDDGMTLVGEGGHAVDEKYLLLRWTRGLDAGVLSGESHVRVSAQIWGMSHSARQQRLATWRRERITKTTESICQTGTAFNESQDAIKREFGESTVAALRQKRIIACTTTGAAIYAEAIKAVAPRFLLVEEAGEILESHILTSLSRTVDQMILIGDHKQLRPKVNNYQLTVERGEGFDLNRSLFERLVLKGYPHETLSTQHRMRPEISAFVRELTYPELTDAPSTQQRPDIRGVQSNIIFVDHSHPEDDNTLIGDRADGGTKSSKQNSYEVQMVLRIVRYLSQQGYKSEDIVVLTPYLGQLHQLRDALKRDNDLILNDIDSSDLARAGISPFAPSSERKAKKSQIYLATIDNYQGEESDIVIASLTRSNKSNMIGFMDSPERLNVLLSRARNGLILIGNSKTFLHSKKGGALWRRFFDLVEKGQFLYRGFPVKCGRHPEHLVLLTRASDFCVHCPDGGCTEPCGFMLACGHACSMKCHPHRSSGHLNPHATSQCKHKMNATCPAGCHQIHWECRLGRPSVCSACVKEAARLEEIARQEREAQRKREEAEAEHHRRMAELEAERATEQRRLQEECEARMWEEQRGVQEEREARMREEQRRQEDEARKRQEEERKQAEENERRRQEREKYRIQEERRQEEERRQRREIQRRQEEKRKQEEDEVRERQEREMRRRQEEEKRRQENEQLRQDALRRIQQQAEQRNAERQRQWEQQLFAAELAKRQERLIAERQQEDTRAALVARVKAERERAAKNSENSRCTVQ